jgi:hypothetical protein
MSQIINNLLHLLYKFIFVYLPITFADMINQIMKFLYHIKDIKQDRLFSTLISIG